MKSRESLLFPTTTFALFFTLVFAGAWALNSNLTARKLLLLAASYVFYGWWDWRFCFLLLGASLVAWISGLMLTTDRYEPWRKPIVMAACAVLLLILGFFKYYGFFLESLQELLFAIGWGRDLPFLQIILPVGISFFTFQAISYVVDVYRNDVTARRNPLDVLLYISFFPQLVAGPIVRAEDFLPQLERQSKLTKSSVVFGLTLCAFGLFKKMVVANYLATDLVDPVFLDPRSYSALVLLMGVYGYAIQIYCDFSGYSDIAIGTAALLGFQFRKNFDQPYRASSLRDFWRRWHMSLSSWLRDYLYIPLGGSKGGNVKTYRNLFATMFLGGLWHGAAWNFVIWGCLHGGWLALERAFLARRESATRVAWHTFLGWLITFHIVCLGWVFFRASNLDVAFDILAGVSSLTLDREGLTGLVVVLIAVSMIFQFTPADLVSRIVKVLGRWPVLVAGIIFIVFVLVTLWFAPPGTAPFIYFQF